MKQFFYLLFLLFSSFTIVLAQSAATESAIKVQLKKLESTSYKDPKEYENHLLKLKAESEKLGYDEGILLSGDYLMTAYNKQDKNKEIVELANQLKNLIKDKKEDPTGVISSIYRKNALALMYLGLDDASKKEVENAIKLAKTIENPDRRYFRLTQSYMDLFSHYHSKNMQSESKANKDSILYYLDKSLNMAEKIKDNNGKISNDKKYAEIIYIYMAKGVFYLQYSDQKGNLQLAENNLLKAEEINKTKGSLSAREKTTLLNQLSWLYLEKKEYQKSIDYASKSLQLEKKENRPTSRVESYEFLATSYMEIGDKEKSKFYMREYTLLKDSLNTANRKNANIAATKMVSVANLEHEEKSRKQLIAAGALILIAGSAAIFLWRRNNKKLRKSYELMIEKLKNETGSQKIESTTTNRNVISSDTEKRILDQLESFESSEEFLKHNLTISLLSTQLSTNSKYLSEIIKNYKSHSFSSYINHLRINYIVHKLYNEPKYRGYKTSHLAEICGYASPQVFFAAFKKINGVTPVYFIQKLNEDEKTI